MTLMLMDVDDEEVEREIKLTVVPSGFLDTCEGKPCDVVLGLQIIT